MRRPFVPLLLLVLTVGINQAQSAGFLRAKEGRIVDGQGREIILRGMGLGGWMLQEGYMLGIRGDGTQHSIKARIADLVGKEDCERFYQLWRENHMTRADVDLLAKSGFKSIRLPMHYNLFTLPVEEEPVKGGNTWLATGFAMTDNLLAWCKANRMYLILDLHAAPGGQGKDANISDYDPAKPSLWESEQNRQKTVALWRKLAERYAQEPWIGGYDLLNEPNWTFEGKDKNGKEDTSNQPIWDLYQAITKAIREVDANHLIIIEGNGWGNNYNGFSSPWDQNMVLSFHKYWNPNTREAIARFLELREKRHLPIWLGESGENNNQWFRDCVALMERNHIGWAWWPHKKVNSSSCTLTITRPEEFKKTVDYWNGGGERPTREIAAKGLFELAENAKASNCRFNTNVVQALIPPDQARDQEPAWRALPLIAGGRVAEDWVHVGWGGFVVDGDALKTECDPKGLGLLVYKKERLGNCQLRILFKSKDAKSNSGVIVRMADGIFDQTNNPGATFDRDARGKISQPSMQRMMASAGREEGPWFAVHRGYEVQIMDDKDPFHRTGAIYSLAASSAIPQKAPGEWKTMIITLAGNRILVDLEGQRVTSFDPESPEVPRNRQWFEPKREPKRPQTGCIGLQNHDPGDIVWFREISVRPLPEARAER